MKEHHHRGASARTQEGFLATEQLAGSHVTIRNSQSPTDTAPGEHGEMLDAGLGDRINNLRGPVGT